MVKIDLNLKRTVLDLMLGGEKLAYCFQCGKCNDVCPISQRWGSRYNPRDLVLFSALGYADGLVAAVKRDPFVLWGCTTCDTCDESCPAHIPITEIINLLKNISVSLGISPPFYPESTKVIYDNGMAIPVQDAIVKRREKLGLSAAPTIPVEEVKTIMEATKITQLMKKE